MRLRYAALWMGFSRSVAIRLEGSCHRFFLKSHVHGEWHAVELQRLSDYLAQAAQDQGFQIFEVDPTTGKSLSALHERANRPVVDVVWGVKSMSCLLRTSDAEALALLQQGKIAGAKQIGRRDWCAPRKSILQYLSQSEDHVT